MGWNSKLGEPRESIWAELVASLIIVTLSVSALAWFVLAPQDTRPVVLIPIDAEARGALAQWIEAPDTQILGRGKPAGSLIIRGRRPGFFEGLANHRVLILNATAPGCGPAKGSAAA